jgi:exonuclease III
VQYLCVHTYCPPKSLRRTAQSNSLNINAIPTSTSYNLNSLSYHHTTNKGARRHRNILKNIKKLAQKNHILAFQETKLNPYEYNALKTVLVGWTLCFSNAPESNNGNTTRRAGLLLCISPLFSKAYDISQYDMGKDTHGHTQAVKFSPNSNNGDLVPFIFINLYLATGVRDNVGEDKRKINQLEPLLRIPSGLRTILCGDFNFIEDAVDTTSASPKNHFLSTDARNVWHRVLDRFNLHEIHQPIHTFLKSVTGPEGYYSSRLDRFYISFSESDYTIHTPTTFLPIIPITAFNRISNIKNDSYRADFLAVCPDHHPVSLAFASTAPSNNKKKPFSIPRWMPLSPVFTNFIRSEYQNYAFTDADLANPFKRNAIIKKISRTAKKFYYDNPPPSHSNKIDLLPGAIRLLRLFDSRVRVLSDISSIADTSPRLAELLVSNSGPGGKFDTIATRKKISFFIHIIFDAYNVKMSRDDSDPLACFTPDANGCLSSQDVGKYKLSMYLIR